MKRELINVVAILGFVLLGAAVILGILTGILFIFPKASIMGARAVKERDTQIVYQDAALADAFANGKFILESFGTHIEVKMSSEGYEGDGTIVVNESATGISFNNLNRTLIEWTQTLYGDNNDLYYRIKVLEPSGMVFSDKPTTVYINLPHRTDDFKYDFVLQNKYSPVNFSFVNDTETNTDKILIHNLIIEDAASVNVPYVVGNTVDNITVNANRTKLVCSAEVKNNVFVHGAYNDLNFGSESTGIVGNVVIDGDHNSFNGTSADKVTFKANHGKLNMSKTIDSLEVATTQADISVNEVSGAVTMDTVTGNLSVNSVGGDLIFNAGTDAEPYATANVNVNNNVSGASKIKNYGIGNINMHGVNGVVDILSKEVGAGNVNVDFAAGASGYKVDILTYDANVSVGGINGGNITLKVLGGHDRAGYANIKTQFNKVGTVDIVSGGYVSGHDDIGNVEVSLDDHCNNVDLYVFNARFANCADKYGIDKLKVSKDKTDSASAKNSIIFDDYSTEGTGSITIDSQNRVILA